MVPTTRPSLTRTPRLFSTLKRQTMAYFTWAATLEPYLSPTSGPSSLPTHQLKVSIPLASTPGPFHVSTSWPFNSTTYQPTYSTTWVPSTGPSLAPISGPIPPPKEASNILFDLGLYKWTIPNANTRAFHNAHATNSYLSNRGPNYRTISGAHNKPI